MTTDPTSALTAAAGPAEIERRLVAEGYVHVAGVIPHPVLDAVEAELVGALRARATAWHRSGRTGGDLPEGDIDLRDMVMVTAALPGFATELLAELDITAPHAPFAVLTTDDVFHLGPAVLDLVTDDDLLDLLAGLLGHELVASANQHCRIKLPTPPTLQVGQHRGADARTLWHQDVVTQMPEADGSHVVTCWIAGHDVDKEDGCLLVVPGRHREGLFPWPFTDAFVARLEADGVAVPARRGDVVLIDKHTPHASLPNSSGRARWSFDLRYHPADHPTDRPWYPAIPVRSTTGPVVRDALEWRALWDGACSALIAARTPLPGRPEWARPMGESLISAWEMGDFPRVAPARPAGV